MPLEPIVPVVGSACFEGKNTLGVRHPDKTLCVTDSVKLYPGDGIFLLEEDPDFNQVCDECGEAI